MFRVATEDWHGGQHSEALSGFAIAVGMTWNGGVRSMAAGPLLSEAIELADRGQLSLALEACAEAADALGPYDDEGPVAYLCHEIEFRMRNPTPPPVLRPAVSPE